MENNPVKYDVAERAKDLARKWPRLEIVKQHEFVRNILRRVTVGETAVWIEVDKSKLIAALQGKKCETVAPSRTGKHDMLKLAGHFQVLRQGSGLRLIAPLSDSGFHGNPVPSLVKAVARARSWYEQMVAGEFSTIGQLADKSGLTRRYVRRILQCANLSPKITEAILMGEHRPDLTLKEILQSVPLMKVRRLLFSIPHYPTHIKGGLPLSLPTTIIGFIGLVESKQAS
jgi:site-specific DNA recombinase